MVGKWETESSKLVRVLWKEAELKKWGWWGTGWCAWSACYSGPATSRLATLGCCQSQSLGLWYQPSWVLCWHLWPMLLSKATGISTPCLPIFALFEESHYEKLVFNDQWIIWVHLYQLFKTRTFISIIYNFSMWKMYIFSTIDKVIYALICDFRYIDI